MKDELKNQIEKTILEILSKNNQLNFESVIVLVQDYLDEKIYHIEIKKRIWSLIDSKKIELLNNLKVRIKQ